MADLISRQAAIEALMEDVQAYWLMDEDGNIVSGCKDVDVVKMLESLPSAQPEVIHCRDCRYGNYDAFEKRTWCKLHPIIDVNDDDFCSKAERKEDG